MTAPSRAASLLCCALMPSLLAQEPQPAARPRVGLVLSGGGARGTAHVGVLQVLEELQIPIHCVAGTSMGAIVGGLYAYGHPPHRLEQLVTREGLERDWPFLLRDGQPYRHWPFRRKEEGHSYLARAQLGVRDFGIRLPKGVVQGQNLETELRFLTLEAHDLASFDTLPIPFRCTAVDIHTGAEVVLDRGNLADAMRASMSLPGVFAPAVVEGRELLDGGLANNVPIDLARAMGAEVLIVIDIGTPIDTEKEITDIFAVTGQMVAILTQQNIDRMLKTLRPDDVLIRPDLGDITSADFLRAAESIEIGRNAALAAAPALRRWSVGAAEYERWLASQRRPPRAAPKVRRVRIANDSALGNELIQTRLELRPGNELSEPVLRHDLEQLFAIDDFQRVRFAIRDWKDDEADVDVATEVKGWGPSFVRFGIALQSDLDQTSYQLAALLVLREVNSLGAELRNVVELGQRMTALSEFYQPLDPGEHFFVAPRARLGRDDADLYVDGELATKQNVRYAETGIDAGVNFRGPGELRFGYQRAWGENRVGLTNQPIAEQDFDDGLLRTLVRLDTSDAPYFARSGVLATAEYRVGHVDLGADENYQAALLRGATALSTGDWTLTPVLEWSSTLTGTQPFYGAPSLGGFARLSGFPTDSLRGQHSFLGTLALRALLSEGFMPVYGGGTIECGNVWQVRDDKFEELIVAGSVFLAFDLPIGPLYGGVGMAEGGEITGFLFLGPDP